MLDQDMLDVDMLVWSSNSSQASPKTQEKNEANSTYAGCSHVSMVQ